MEHTTPDRKQGAKKGDSVHDEITSRTILCALRAIVMISAFFRTPRNKALYTVTARDDQKVVAKRLVTKSTLISDQ